MSKASPKATPAKAPEEESAAAAEGAAKPWAAKKARKKQAKQESLTSASDKDKEALAKKIAGVEIKAKANEKLKKKGKMTKKEKYKARKAELKAAKAKVADSTAPGSKRPAEGPANGGVAKKQKLDPLAVRCFVTGLPYKATESHIEKHFQGVGQVSVEILRHKDNGNPNGTAFLTFETAEQAAEACTYDRSEIQKRWIGVRHCEVRENDKSRAVVGLGEKPDGCDSIVLTGLMPTVEDDDLWSFFEDCDVKSVSRMMCRETDKFRGMAFVDFTSTEGVDMAVKKKGQALKGSSGYRIRYKHEKAEKAHNSSSGRIASHNQASKVPDWKGTRKTLDSDSDDE